MEEVELLIMVDQVEQVDLVVVEQEEFIQVYHLILQEHQEQLIQVVEQEVEH